MNTNTNKNAASVSLAARTETGDLHKCSILSIAQSVQIVNSEVRYE